MGLLLLSIYLVLFLVGFLLRFFVGGKLVSDEDIRTLYTSHTQEVERLRNMYLEDRQKSNSRFFSVSANTSESDCVRRGGSVERCQEYARLFTKVKVGIVYSAEGCVLLNVDGWGGFGEGKRKGLMWTTSPITQQDKRSLQRYVQIDDNWYIYEIYSEKALFDSGNAHQ